MTLSESAAAYLARFPAVAVPEPGSAAAAEYMAAARAAAPRAQTGESVADIRDEVIADALRVRIYSPDSGSDRRVIVYLHGGGWVLGDLNTNDATCRRLANTTGSVVVSVDYRLAPEHPFPSAVSDAGVALRWCLANPDRLRIDPGRCVVAGSSSGGALAAALALDASASTDRPLAGQLLLYPALDSAMNTPSYQEFASGYGLTAAAMRFYWHSYVTDLGELTLPAVSPSHAERIGHLPATMVVTVEHDVLRDEGRAYSRRLEQAGVSTEHLQVDGQIHGFLASQPDAPESAQTLRLVAQWLTRTV